ncbi:unnamed protein product [Sphagnum troendelagicum]|uniref:Uncharacterized protein n=1 Tax=Sphagnum troendelagicum TaxID=128251 RepID=A0ABP0TDF8_9BRYO
MAMMMIISGASCIDNFVLRLGLSMMVVACSSSIMLIDSARTADMNDKDFVVETTKMKLKNAAVELDFVHEYTAAAAAAAAMTHERSNSQLQHRRRRVSESSDLHMTKTGEEEEEEEGIDGVKSSRYGNKQDDDDEEEENLKKKRLQRFLRFSDYIDPKDHPPEEPPSLGDP